MDFNKLIARARGMLLGPRAEWPAAAAEADTVQSLYLNYIVVLAAIPPVFRFLRGSLIGYSFLGVTVRAPLGAGLAGLVLGYALSLATTFVMALVVEALAPSFGGRKDRVQALKCVAYAWTPYWLSGVAAIIPVLGALVMLAGLAYSVYLLYLGLPVAMRCPREKSAGYTAVSVLVAIVLGVALAWIVGAMTAVSPLGIAHMHSFGGN